ncbi:MAG: outer membrane beta-barrel protein [Halioglobus sp.]|nr:outer membrane beta-barrel protein [Halioglobus sp.]
MTARNYLVAALLVAATVMVVPAWAQEEEGLIEGTTSTAESAAQSASSTPEDSSGGVADHELAFDYGNLTFYPLLNVGLGFSNDLYDDEGQKKSAAFTTTRAGGGVQGENRGHLYGVEYSAERFWYLDNDIPDDDEISQRTVGYWGTGFDVRNNLDLGVEYLDSYDPRGQDDPLRDIRDTTTEEDPDTWTQLAYGANYGYGAPGAQGRIELGACETCKRYDDNDQEYRDRDITDLGATLYVRMTGRTEGFAQMVYSDFDYRNDTPDDPALGRNLDSEEWRYMLGATWLASEKTTGIARIGTVKKEFKDPVRNNSNYDEITWDAVLNWTPTSRDNIAVGYFRMPQEPLVWELDELQDDFVETEQLSVDWSRQLRADLVFDVGGYAGTADWKPSGRNDDLWGATAGLRFNLPRWGSLGISYYHRERDSSDSVHNYSDDGFIIDFNLGSLFGFGDSRAPAICLLRGFSSNNDYNGFSGY